MATHDDEICSVLTRIALAGDGVVLGLGLAVTAICTWFRFYSHSKALQQIEDTPESRISDLKCLICELNEAATSSHTSQSHSLKQGSSATMVIVRGKVSSKASVESQWGKGATKVDDLLIAQESKEKAVIVEMTQTCLYNEWRGLFGWSSDWSGLLGWGSLKEQVTKSMRKVPFVLVEDRWFQSSAFAHISMKDSYSHHPLPLVTVYHQLHPVQASPYTFVQAIFGRGYPVGLLDVEKILPLGKEITAVGILDVAPDNQPEIKPSKYLPVFMTEFTRDQLIADLAAGRRVLFWTGVILSTLAAGVLGYAFFKNWQKYKLWRVERIRRAEQARQDILSADGANEDTTDVPDVDLCVVCLLRRRRSAFLPCGHLVCCACCAQRVEQDLNARCPMCRQNVNGTIRIYDS